MAAEEHLESLAKRARITISFEEPEHGRGRRHAPAIGDEEFLEELASRAAERAVRLYAETHPRPTQVNQQQAAEMLGVSPKTVHRYIRAGLLKYNGCGQLPIESIDKIRAAG